MKTLSQWARCHPRTTIFIIILLHIVAGFNALVLGILLSLEEWIAPRWLVLLFVHLFFLAYILYPSRKGNRWSIPYSYVRQKVLDFTLILAASLTIAFGLSRLWISPANEIAPAKAHFINYEPASEKQIESSKRISRLKVSAKTQKIRKQVRKNLREIRKTLKKQQNRKKRNWTRFLLIFFGSLITLGLALLLAGLSCSIACSGQGGLALIVLIGGLAGLVWLVIIGIKAMDRRYPIILKGEAENINTGT